MKSCLRSALADSHVSTIALSVLLVWALDLFFRGIWRPLATAAEFLVTAIAIRDIPYSSGRFTSQDMIFLVWMLSYIVSAFLTVLAAWLLSKRVYGIGPIRAMARDLEAFQRRKN
jgi:hypothetical protein